MSNTNYQFKRKAVFIFFFMILSLSLPDVGMTQYQRNLVILDVTLTVVAPFSSATIFVKNYRNEPNPQAIYTASSPDTGIEKQTQSKAISSFQFNELTDLIKEYDFWSLNEVYMEKGLMDVTNTTISVKSIPQECVSTPALCDAAVYTVSCSGSCPKEITEIIDKIKELWDGEILEVGV